MSAAFSFEYKFVLPVPDEYMCPICNCPMREPVQTKCGHRFCKHCLGQALKRKPECPIDRTSLNHRRKTDIFLDVASKRTILDFQVKCSNEGHGCRWMGELRTVEEHAASCSFTRVRCTNEGCETTLFKGDLQNHVTNECTKRAVVCEHCHTPYIWCFQERHFKTCERFPCLCLQDCGQEDVPRNKMDDHIETVCPRTEVSCTYSNVGCQAKVQRQVLMQHVKDNFEFHLTLACEKMKALQDEVVSMKKEMKEVSATCPGNESIQELREEVRTVNEQMRTISTEVPRKKEISELNAEVAAGNESIKELREEVRTVNEQMRTISTEVPRKKEISELKAEVAAGNESIKELREKIRTVNEEVRTIWTKVPRKEDISELNAAVAATNRRLQDVIGPVQTTKLSYHQFRKLEEDVTKTSQRLQDLRAEIVSARKSEEENRRNALERLWNLDKAREQVEIEVEKQKRKQTELIADYNNAKGLFLVVAFIVFVLLGYQIELQNKLKRNQIL